MKQSYFFGLCVSLLLVLAMPASAALNAYLTLTSKGTTARKVAISSFSWGVSNPSSVKSPRDAASGLATGKRQHKPITIIKEIDKATPLLYKAVFEGTKFDNATLEVFNVDEKGAETLLYTIELTGVWIATGDVDGDGLSESSRTAGSGGGTGKVSLQDFHFSIRYEKIQWIVDGKIEAEDSWEVR